MSKKARLKKKLRRKLQAAWRKYYLQRELEICLDSLLSIGVCGIVDKKDGIIRAATPDEIEDVLSNGQIMRRSEIRYNELESKFRQSRRLRYNILDMVLHNEQRR